jgi:hypothetical protein
MTKPKSTSPKVASEASRIMRDNRFGKAAKEVAASALSQAKPKPSPKKKK